MTDPPCSKSNISLVNGRLNNQEQQQKYNYKVMHTISNQTAAPLITYLRKNECCKRWITSYAKLYAIKSVV